MTDRELLEKAALAAWLQWCLDNCDNSPEHNFGTEATKNMRDLLAGTPASMPDAQRCKGMMMEWMPIETAPKDGEWVLLQGFDPDQYGDPLPPVVVAFWCEESFWAYCYWDSNWRSTVENPKQWMPIPQGAGKEKPSE